MPGPRFRSAQLTEPAPSQVTEAIVAQTTLGIWVLDRNDCTIFVNDRMAEIIGATVDELIGAPVHDFLDAASGAATRTALHRRRVGAAEMRELELRRRDGMVLQTLVESMPMTDEDGDYTGSVAVVADITRRKQVEQEVGLLAALVQSSSDAIFACSLDGTVKSWNPAAEALFGWSADEITSLPVLIQAAPDSVGRFITAAANGEPVGPLEIDTLAKDGTPIPVELTAFPVDDGVGRISMVAVTMRDIRERREAERLMREAERVRTDVESIGRIGTFEWMIDTAEVVWSDEVWRIHDRAPGGQPGIGYLDSVHAADREQLHEAVIESIERMVPLDVRYRIVLPSGAIRWVHSHAEPAGVDGPRRMLGTLRDITEIVDAEEEARRARAELDRQVLHDPLTSLPNRTLLLDRLSMALAQAERARSGVAVFVCDIDRFALVNEEMGHGVADQLLKAVAQRLVGIMRGGDTVGRTSGDEFAIVCEAIEPDKTAVDGLASRVLDAFGEPFAIGGEEVYLVASVGAAWASDEQPAAALLARAAAALQTAKERERGSFVVARPDGWEPYAGRGRLALRHALREAIGTDQLRVVYQPIVSLRDRRQIGLEALLRWEHPGLGPVSPLEFIPVAEDTGMILPIGKWVIEEACRALARIDGDRMMGVNLSPRQLMHDDLGQVVGLALLESGVRPERLVLELTESILVEESSKVGETLADLKDLGVKLALDDFGTGYSALSYLKRFPFDMVKIDRSFVRGLGHDSEDSAIVGAVMGMARALGMEVVAEGIETEEQLACLRELGAELGQGFLFARPGPL